MKAVHNTAMAAAVIGLLGMAALPASADDVTTVTAANVTEVGEVTVNYADLNLSSPEGQEALYNRIASAARQVCGPTDYRRAGGISYAKSNRQCFADSLSRAMSEIPQAQVASSN